uniref:WASH complex subunit 3 n=1 Tax=Anopheles christyi TaxID=43041 RepID=A0A182KII3_9DIPT
MESLTVQKHELPPTNQKRMVAFINHFIVSTVTFLNKFASDCESKFVTYEQKIQNLEASLMIVEAKLASIDVLKQHNDTPAIAETKQRENQPTVVVTSEGEPKPEGVVKPQPETTAPNPPAIEKDPKYDLYFKMLQLGVPLGAVKNKISCEGLDPDYIDGFL